MTESDPRPDPATAADPAASPSLSGVPPTPVEGSEQGAAPVLVTDLASKTLAVKEGQTFLYSDLEGNLDHGGRDGLGFFLYHTPFLPALLLTLKRGGTAPTAGETVSACIRTTRGSCRTSA